MLRIHPYGPCLTNWERREQRYQQWKCQTIQNTFNNIQHLYECEWNRYQSTNKQNTNNKTLSGKCQTIMNINYCVLERESRDRPLSTDTKTQCGITAYSCSIQPLRHQSPKECKKPATLWKHMLGRTPHYSCNTYKWYLGMCDTDFKEKLRKDLIILCDNYWNRSSTQC